MKQALNSPDIFPLPPRLLTFVRHPLDRAISHYNMDVSFPQKDNLAYSFDDFLTEHDGQKWKHFMSNAMRGGLGKKNREGYEYWFIGVTEYFESSLCILYHKMGIPDREGRCKCSNRRGSEGDLTFQHNDHGVHGSPRHITQANLTEKMIECILDHNQADLSLFYSALVRLKNEADSIQSDTGIDLLCQDDRKRLVEALRVHHANPHRSEVSDSSDGSCASKNMLPTITTNAKGTGYSKSSSDKQKATANDDDDDDDSDDADVKKKKNNNKRKSGGGLKGGKKP